MFLRGGLLEDPINLFDAPTLRRAAVKLHDVAYPRRLSAPVMLYENLFSRLAIDYTQNHPFRLAVSLVYPAFEALVAGSSYG